MLYLKLLQTPLPISDYVPNRPPGSNLKDSKGLDENWPARGAGSNDSEVCREPAVTGIYICGPPPACY